VVSKNGNLLLNVPVRGDGTIDEKEIVVIEGITAWMDVNKESIFGTRPWKIFGEGPAADAANPIHAQGFNEGRIKFSAKDVRFNARGNMLYATVMGVPVETVRIKALGTAAAPEKITKVEMLGSREQVQWLQRADALEIIKPNTVPSDIAVVYKIYR
jgi:alpha-L-fucosidase